VIELRPATATDASAAAAFLQRSLGQGSHYARYVCDRWARDRPRGYLLADGGVIHGFFTTTYAQRWANGNAYQACNVHSIAVDPAYRQHTLKLFKAALADRSVGYTCFTASDAAAEVFRFFRFVETPCVRWAVSAASGALATLTALPRLRVYLDAATIARRLPAELATVSTDHRGCAQVLCEVQGQQSLIIAIARGRRLRFGEVLYVSNPSILPQSLAATTLGLAAQLRTPIVSYDSRWLPNAPWFARKLLRRPRHVRAPADWPFDDMLYSELVLRYGRRVDGPEI